MSNETKYRTQKTTEAGTVLVMAAILVFAIMSIVALGIDITYSSASLEQARHNAKLSALAAIDAYMKSDELLEEDRRNDALVRADEVASLNLMVGDLSSSARQLELYAANPTSIPGLVPGRWYYALNSDGSDPCVNGESVPCFVPHSQDDDEITNAFQLVGHLYDNVPAKFARAFGVQTVTPVTVDAIATIVPRHGCFVVDLSSSMVRETHLDGVAEFVFNMSEPDHQQMYSNLGATRANASPVAQADPTIHFQDDYVPLSSLLDSDFTSGGYDTHHPDPNSQTIYRVSSLASANNYLVDVYRDSVHRGPEPLRTVFEGLRTAIQAFRKRATSGDKACIIFHDSAFEWPRIINLTDDFDYLESLTDFDYDPNVDTLNPNSGFGLMIAHRLFPEYGAQTDIKKALGEALRQFSDYNTLSAGVPISNFIVIISDGLINCTDCLDDAKLLNDYDLNGNGVFDATDTAIADSCINGSTMLVCSSSNLDANVDGLTDSYDVLFLNNHVGDIYSRQCNVLGCSHNYPHFKMASDQLLTFVEQRVARANIELHVILAGSHVAPHTVDYDDGNGGCMNDAQARHGLQSFVRGGDASGSTMSDPDTAFDTMSAANPFYEANSVMYDLARLTGGVWGPLRPPGPAPCVLCDPNQTRRITDPLCRPLAEQMNHYMDRIMSENPYQIVRERM